MCAVASFCSAAENETAKWQAEIDRASASGGGVVSVPAGVHRVGGLELRSNVELRLEKGAVLEALYGLENYRVVKLPYSEGDWSAVVMGLNVTNAAVTGDGTIDGRGALWPPTPKGFKGCHEGLRPRGLFFAYSKDIRLEGYTLRNTALNAAISSLAATALVATATSANARERTMISPSPKVLTQKPDQGTFRSRGASA